MPSNFYSLFSRFIRRFRQALPPEFGTTLSIVRDRKLSFRKMRFGCFSPIAQSNFVNTFSSRLIDKSCLSVVSDPIRLRKTSDVDFSFPCAQNATGGRNRAVRSVSRIFGVRFGRYAEPRQRNQPFCRDPSFSQKNMRAGREFTVPPTDKVFPASRCRRKNESLRRYYSLFS